MKTIEAPQTPATDKQTTQSPLNNKDNKMTCLKTPEAEAQKEHQWELAHQPEHLT